MCKTNQYVKPCMFILFKFYAFDFNYKAINTYANGHYHYHNLSLGLEGGSLYSILSFYAAKKYVKSLQIHRLLSVAVVTYNMSRITYSYSVIVRNVTSS